MPYSRGSSQPKDGTQVSYVSCIGRQLLYHECHLGSLDICIPRLIQKIKNRWKEYTEELHEKDFNDPDNQNDMITHLEPDILE